jgi:hypothetical protein
MDSVAHIKELQLIGQRVAERAVDASHFNGFSERRSCTVTVPRTDSSSELLVPPTCWRSSMCGRTPPGGVALQLVDSAHPHNAISAIGVHRHDHRLRRLSSG